VKADTYSTGRAGRQKWDDSMAARLARDVQAIEMHLDSGVGRAAARLHAELKRQGAAPREPGRLTDCEMLIAREA